MTTEVGVVVGRFQVHQLHDGHLDLIEHAAARHRRLIVVLGLAPVKGTRVNPLDFESRKQMVLERFSKATVLYVKDSVSDEAWSRSLDSLIDDMLGPEQTAVIYGSRDSFADHYSGKHRVEVVETKRIISGTQIRNEIAAFPRNSAEFRAGAIWQAYNRFPTAFMCVDVAMWRMVSVNPEGGIGKVEVLLGRKPHETGFRFFGGFVQPEDATLEIAARRELLEEAGGVDTSDMRYVGSFSVDDWRYRREVDKIKTALFSCRYLHGRVQAGDDMAEAHWVEVPFGFQPNSPELNEFVESFVPNHRQMAVAFVRSIYSVPNFA